MISTIIGTTTTLTSNEIVTYSVVAISALILLLAINAILSPAEYTYRISSIIKGSNLAIVPLLLIFIFIVIYKSVTP